MITELLIVIVNNCSESKSLWESGPSSEYKIATQNKWQNLIAWISNVGQTRNPAIWLNMYTCGHIVSTSVHEYSHNLSAHWYSQWGKHTHAKLETRGWFILPAIMQVRPYIMNCHIKLYHYSFRCIQMTFVYHKP